MKSIKNIFKTVKTTIGNSFNKKVNTDATSTYFKKVNAKDVPENDNSGNYRNANGVRIENRIKELDRVVLRGTNRTRVITKIEETVFRANFNRVAPDLQEACEIAHYAVVNNLPVRVSVIKRILPNVDITDNDIIDEMQYEQWMRYKDKEENIVDPEIEVEDTYGMRNDDGVGKKSHEEWSSNRKPGSGWGKKTKF